MKKVNQVVTATITTLLLCGVSAVQAWTTEDTEEYWAAKADKAMRITIAPRSMRADAEAGEEMLEEFGAKYLPNAYTLYRAKREKAKEREAVLKENFPDGRRPSSTERVFYDKVAKAVAKAVAEMDRRHDELCYYYLLHKIGVVTDAELAKIDSSPIAIMLFQEGELKDVSIYKEIKEDQRAFAEKYLPTVLADYDFLVNAFSEVKAVYADGVKMDAGNAGFVLRPIAERLDEIRQKINTLADTMRQQKAYYALEETTAEELAELDRKVGCEIKRFKEIPPLRHCVRSWLDEKWTEREWRLLVPLSTRKQARTMVRMPRTPPPLEGKIPGRARDFGKGTAAEDPLKNVDMKKMLEMGYRYGARNQLATSEAQRCVSLIKVAIHREWNKESFTWYNGLRPIKVDFQLGAGGVVRSFAIQSGSGDAGVDRTAVNALRRLKDKGGIPGLSKSFIDQYPRLTVMMEPTQGR